MEGLRGRANQEEGDGYKDYYLQYDDEDFAVSCFRLLWISNWVGWALLTMHWVRRRRGREDGREARRRGWL